MCDLCQFLVAVVIKHVNTSELARSLMESVLLKFGLCLVVVADNVITFKGVFVQMGELLNVQVHPVAKCNHTVIGI